MCFTAELDWCPLLRVDSQVVDLVFAMEDMERGLQEMAQSVEHMQEMLKRSPMVQALAQRKPEVRTPSALLAQNGRRGFYQVTVYEATRRCFTHQIAFPTDDGGLSLKNSISILKGSKRTDRAAPAQVKQIMNDPKKLQEEMALVQRNLAALQKAEQAMRNPYKRQQVPGERSMFERRLER